MKRKLAYFALPLILAALIFAVKWRAEHPTPTKEDLVIRALILQSSNIVVSHIPNKPQRRYIPLKLKLTVPEMKSLCDWFYLSPPSKNPAVQTGKRGMIQILCWLAKPREDGVVGVFVNIGVDKREGRAILGHPRRIDERTLHPVTVKHWLELLQSNPRIGPELRARLQ